MGLENFPRAAGAVLINLDLKKGTKDRKLRSFCSGTEVSYMGIDYLASVLPSRGSKEDKERRVRATKDFIRLGVKMNNWFDTGELDPQEYKGERRGISEEVREKWRWYFKEIRRIEKGRPEGPFDKGKVFSYREELNLVTLAGLMSVLVGDETGVYLSRKEESSFDLKDEAPDWFKSLFFMTMGLQVADDFLGWRGDVKAKRPSFYTGIFGLIEVPVKTVEKQMKVVQRKYLDRARHYNKEKKTGPMLLMADVSSHLLPVLGIVQKSRFWRNTLFSERDANEE
jgi:hypothetical protein